MTPDERTLLSGLFDRLKDTSTAERDREAETFIKTAVAENPNAAYFLAQAVLVQEEALKAAAGKIEDLEGDLQRANQQSSPADSGSGFLGGISKSIFGGDGENQQYSERPGSPFGRRETGSSGVPSTRSPTSGISVPRAGDLADRQPPAAAGQSPQGGSFLKGAMGTAAGVAGGILLANSISGLFSGSNNPLGIGVAKANEAKTPSDTKSDNNKDSQEDGDDWGDDDDWGADYDGDDFGGAGDDWGD